MWKLRALRTLGKNPSGQTPLRGLRQPRARLTFNSVMGGLAMQVCVRGWNTGVGPSSSRKNPRKVVLSSSAISWSEFIREPLGWRSCRMRAVNRLFLLTCAKIFLGAVFAEFASLHSNERRSACRVLLDLRCSCWRWR